jgi:hypothetical protein
LQYRIQIVPLAENARDCTCSAVLVSFVPSYSSVTLPANSPG